MVSLPLVLLMVTWFGKSVSQIQQVLRYSDRVEQLGLGVNCSHGFEVTLTEELLTDASD